MNQEQIRFRNPVKSLGFAQTMHAMTLDDRISDGAFRYYNLLLYWAHQKDKCWPKRSTIADLWERGERTISRYNTELEEAGYITRQRRLGISSVTWIEDAETIPYLMDLAISLLDDRAEDGTTHVPNLAPHMCKNGHVLEEEPKKKNQEEEPKGGGATCAIAPAANAPAVDAALYEDYAYIVDYDDEDSFKCPACNKECGWPQKRTNFTCPHCYVPLAGYEWGTYVKGKTPDWKPPRRKQPSKHKQVMENLIPSLKGGQLEGVPYKREDKAGLVEMLSKDGQLLIEELIYQAQLYAKRLCPPMSIAHNALVTAQKRYKASGKESNGSFTAEDYSTVAGAGDV